MSAAVATREAPQLRALPPVDSNAPRIVTLDLDNAAQIHSTLMEFRNTCLTPGVDYGVIQGTQGNTLYKPGAEKLLYFFGLSFQLEITSRIEDWDKNRFAYEVKAIVRSKRSGEIEAEGIGSCNNKERRYLKQDGANVANTCLKMAKKRALVDATLTATRSSGIFLDEDGDKEDSPRQNHGQQNRQQPRPQQQRHQPQRPAQVQQPGPGGGPALANRAQLDRCERARSRALELGYAAATGKNPLPVAEGASLDEVQTKCKRWEKFIAENDELNVDTPSAPQPKSANRGTRYAIPDYMLHRAPTNCRSCGAQVYFIKAPESGKTVPVNVDGYSHFTTCPNAAQHSQKNQGAVTPAAPISGGPLTNLQKRLWAVAAEQGLPEAKDGPRRQERLDSANQILLDHQLDAVESWGQLSDDQAKCLITAIENGWLSWGHQKGRRN